MHINSDNNLLIYLHRWASNQDENFTTEAFVHLLKHLIEFETNEALYILNNLTCNELGWTVEELSKTTVKSQVTTETGTPDIEIRAIDKLIYIEVKVESGFGDNQIKRYQDTLLKSSFKNTFLIVLTKYPFFQVSDDKQPNAAFRFHHLVDWLDSIKPKHEKSAYIINQFNNFLKSRGIAMEAVSWELVNGLRSFRSLLDMIQEALVGNNIPVHQRSAGWNWYGYYLEKTKLFVGVYFDKPNMVVFDTEVPCKITDAASLKFGRLEGGKWYNELDLESEEAHFFARSKASQIQFLEKFTKESFEYAITLVE